MGSRGATLAEHLPSLYREGPLVNGLLGDWGVQVDLLDEAARRIQRARWFDTTLRLDEAAALAALLDLVPEDFHTDLDEFRAWVHSLRDARLQAGAVTREAIRIFVDRYLRGFEAGSSIELVPSVPSFAIAPTPDRVALVENPPRLRHARLPEVGAIEPLARIRVDNRGLDPAAPAVVITSLGSVGGEFAPLLANLTTGEAIVWLGHVPAGKRLTIAAFSADATTRLAAGLEGADVSDRLRVIPDLRVGSGGPGVYAPDLPVPRLAVGANDLWFLPVAHYDAPGLDRVLLAMADLMLQQGRWDESRFDQSLFVMPAAATVQMAWIEQVPAAFEVNLPAHTLRSRDELADALAARDRLGVGLGEGVSRLAAAGVDGRVRLAARSERQPSTDRLVAMFPMTIREAGSTGGDRLSHAGGTFGVTSFDNSTMN